MKPARDGVWHPTPEFQENSNLAQLIRRMGCADYDEFLKVSISQPEKYWDETLAHMGIVFDPPATRFVDLSQSVQWAKFFPDAGFNFAEACIRHPADQAGAPALIFESEDGVREVVSYGELAERTRSLAAGLRSIGIGKGDRVGYFFPSTPTAVITFLALGYIGAISVPLYSGFGAEAICRRMQDSGAKHLIAEHGYVRKGRSIQLEKVAAEAIAELGDVQLILSCPEGHDRHGARWRLEDLFLDSAGTAAARTKATDPFMVIYTSGTSGKPKGAVHVHAGFPLRVAQDVAFLFDFKAGDRYFWPADMGWMVGPYSICCALLLKGALVLYSGAPDVPDIGRLRAVVARSGATHFGSTPTAIRNMALDEETALREPVPSLRVMMSGGEVIDSDAYHWFFYEFGGGKLPVINYTGGTECSGCLLTNVVLRPIKPCRFNSTAPGVDVRIINESGKPVQQAAGELAVFSPFNGMTNGFWNDPERYLDTYWSQVPDVWVHGDLAIQEEDGQILLIGRSDDVMKVSGRRVGPSEIEGSIIDGRHVSEAVAFGTPDPVTGDAMIVFVVPGDAAEEKEIEAYVNATLRRTMGPSYKANAVVVMPELIKTRNGKLVRRLARQAWLGEKAGDLTSVENPAVFEDVMRRCEAYRQSRHQSS